MLRLQQQFRALGSDVVVTLVFESEKERAELVASKIVKICNEFEQQFSRFIKTSELTKFNIQAGHKTTVSKSFTSLLQLSKKLSLQTGGVFNPFILPALQKAGYLKSRVSTSEADPSTNFSKRQVVSAKELRIGDSWAKIPKGTALDFGGIGKGYLLDKLSKLLDDQQLFGYWLSLGGDIVCAGSDLDNKDWQIMVQSAQNPNKVVKTINSKSSQLLAIATSGVTKRQGIKNGKSWHHIIDPTTGKPSKTNILTATVTSRNAILADVYAKCIVITGEDQAEKYKQQGYIQSFFLQFNEA